MHLRKCIALLLGLLLMGTAATAFAQQTTNQPIALEASPTAVEQRTQIARMDAFGGTDSSLQYTVIIGHIAEPLETTHRVAVTIIKPSTSRQTKSPYLLTATLFEEGKEEDAIAAQIAEGEIRSIVRDGASAAVAYQVRMVNLKRQTTYRMLFEEQNFGASVPITFRTGPEVDPTKGPQLPDDAEPGEVASIGSVLSIVFPKVAQVITDTSVAITGKVTLKIPGPLPVALDLEYGPSPSQIGNRVEVLNTSLVQGTPATFSQALTKFSDDEPFEPGDIIYFRVKDTIRNTASDLLWVRTKGGTDNQPAASGVTELTDSLGSTGNDLEFDSNFLINDPFENKGLVPCATTANPAMCTWDDFLQLIANIIDFLLVLLVPAAAIATVIAGVNLIFSRGKPDGITKAKELFVRIVIATIVVMSAWVIVATFYRVLGVEEKYIMIDIFS